MSTPFVAGLITGQLEIYPPLSAVEQIEPQPAAIVVLSGNRYDNAYEYSGETIGSETLARVRYGAYLQRKTGLPILVSGGLPGEEFGLTLAELMAEVLQEEMNAGVVWLEDRSRTTAENAFYSRTVLAKKNIDRIFLVTDAWHLLRAKLIFEKAGFEVHAAPTSFIGRKDLQPGTLLPKPRSLSTSRASLRELGAYLWYEMRY